MKLPVNCDSDLDISRDSSLLISAIVSAAKRDEDLARCLIELGTTVCRELGMDAVTCVRNAQCDLQFIEEQEMEFALSGGASLH